MIIEIALQEFFVDIGIDTWLRSKAGVDRDKEERCHRCEALKRGCDRNRTQSIGKQGLSKTATDK